MAAPATATAAVPMKPVAMALAPESCEEEEPEAPEPVAEAEPLGAASVVYEVLLVPGAAPIMVK